MKTFGQRLAEAVLRQGTPLCVGLDPRKANLPASLQPAEADHLPSVADAYRRFCCEVIDVVAPLVAVVKPQSAFFEQLGPPGFQALADTIQHARRRNLLVILDGKRNDIGTTAEAYASAYLAKSSPLAADALTVSPYLGTDSLEPFAETCQQSGSGLFVLVKTSNPGGGVLQDLIADGRPLYRHVAEIVAELAEQQRGDETYSSIGAVVGATYPEQLAELRAALPHSWLLVPGLGAQGAAADQVAAAFDPQGLGAVINSSRAIIFAHQRPEYARHAHQWQSAVEAATRDTIAQLAAALGR